MKKNLLLLTAFVMSVSLNAQKWDDYQTVTSQGSIPKDFTEFYTKKYEKQRSGISQNKSRKGRKTEDQFYQRSEFFINDYLESGNVLFGDSISLYCQNILNTLLKDDPKLRKEIRVYAVKSPVVNAYATGNGIIFVNLGLIAEVENEAQLAAVLAHELIHYREDHTLNSFVERDKIENSDDFFNRKSEDEKFNEINQYSKQLELDADASGFKDYYVKAGYAPYEAYLVLDILQYSYLPFDEIPFDPAFLETSSMRLPQSYFLSQVNPITADEDYDDENSSHPNIRKRKEAVGEMMDGSEGQQYLVSKDWFKKAQRTARYECSNMYLARLAYADAIYNSFLLKETYGSDKFQRLTVAKALSTAATYRHEEELEDISSDVELVEGEIQQVHNMLASFNEEDLRTLAVAYSYELHQDYPEDEHLEYLFKKNLYDLTFDTELKMEDYDKENSEQSIVVEKQNLLDSLAQARSGRSSKIKNIKEKEARTAGRNLEAENYYRTAFIPYFDDSLFVSTFEDFESRAVAYHESKEGEDDDESDSFSNTQDEKYEENDALGIDKIVLISPAYLKLDEREADNIDYLQTDESLSEYREEILSMAKLVGLEVDLLDYKELSHKDVDRFNDLAILQSWVDERLKHKNTGSQVSKFDQASYLREKYNTDYVAYTGNISLRERKEGVVGAIVYGVIIPPLLPFIIFDATRPEYHSFNFFYVFDLETGDALLADYNYYETKDSPDYMRSMIYNNLLQIKDKPKK